MKKEAAWEKKQTFRHVTTGSLRNDFWEASANLGSASDCSYREGNLLKPIRSTTQIWEV